MVFLLSKILLKHEYLNFRVGKVQYVHGKDNQNVRILLIKKIFLQHFEDVGIEAFAHNDVSHCIAWRKLKNEAS